MAKVGKIIVLVSCCKLKRREDHELKSEDLYVSSLFKKSLIYAKKIRHDAIYILSDYYHVLPLDKLVSYYDKTLSEMKMPERKSWAKIVLKQLEDDGVDLDADTFIILAGKIYYQHLIGTNGIKNFCMPLEGKRIGQRLKCLDFMIGNDCNIDK